LANISNIETVSISSGPLTAHVLNFGAALMDLSIAMPEGQRSVILNLGNPNAYFTNPHYLGVIAGRCANRIRRGDCVIAGRTYQLDRNEGGENHLHGGSGGFSHQLWWVAQRSPTSVELRLHSPDGDQGYPGNMDASCLYETLPGARLRITLKASCDAATLANFAPHAYFNLSPGSSVLDHMLQMNAAHYLPVDSSLIPLGSIEAVSGTCFDFTQSKRIGERREESVIGYDHNFVLAHEPRREPRLAATLISPGNDLSMEISTTEPGLQFYDGHKLTSDVGVNTRKFMPFDGCCIEPQRFPDAIHNPHFASAILPVGQVYTHVTEYRFFTPSGN
jgi:aldose 1-epimerase